MIEMFTLNRIIIYGMYPPIFCCDIRVVSHHSCQQRRINHSYRPIYHSMTTWVFTFSGKSVLFGNLVQYQNYLNRSDIFQSAVSRHTGWYPVYCHVFGDWFGVNSIALGKMADKSTNYMSVLMMQIHWIDWSMISNGDLCSSLRPLSTDIPLSSGHISRYDSSLRLHSVKENIYISTNIDIGKLGAKFLYRHKVDRSGATEIPV